MAEGLFLASTSRFVFDVTGPPGSGERVTATRFYLLSADGRFHRGWDLPSVPGGVLADFDFAAAGAADPYNTGTYCADADHIALHPIQGDPENAVLTSDGLLAEQLVFTLSSRGA